MSLPVVRIEAAYNESKMRHQMTAQAMIEGITKAGDVVSTSKGSRPDGLVVYGWCEPASDYVRRQIPVLTMDMPWYGRLHPSNPQAYVKLSVNNWHPTRYFQARPKPMDRWERLGLTIQPMRRYGGKIVVAGSGPKSSVRDGNEFQAWERAAIEQLRGLTDREIVYRPKPYMKQAAPPLIEGSVMDNRTPIATLLAGAHAVVTRQSNVAVDALRMGIPVFCWEGVGSVLALQDLTQIEKPLLPSMGERRQFFADLAYCQWTMAELRSGAAWRHIREEGLI